MLIKHETHALFLGTIPMAVRRLRRCSLNWQFVTIISGIAFVGEDYGLPTARAASALWWVAGLMALGTAFGVPIAMFKYHQHESSGITALWLLPVVPVRRSRMTGLSDLASQSRSPRPVQPSPA